MKKYNVYNLYVVEIQKNNDTHYFICKRSHLNNNYIEIFTNEKMEITNNTKIELLSNYFPNLMSNNYTIGKPLMMDKKELLTKYIEINRLEKDSLCTYDNILDEEINELEKATLNFFPKEGIWYSSCFNQPKDLSMSNLPCHLNDDLWLAKMLRENQKIFYISVNNILHFIKTSPFFQEKRHEYEQKIVKWQIDWMVTGGEGWLVDEEYGGDFIYLSPMCDLGFRKGVVDTLLKIGMNIEAIEEGIEKNAHKWRDLFMHKAFNNEYKPIFLASDFRGYLESNEYQREENKTLQPLDLEFEENWLKLRKYEYYQTHKGSVDKYGVVDSDMMLSDEEVSKIRVYLNQKHNERMEQIEQYEQEIKESKGKIKVLNKR